MVLPARVLLVAGLMCLWSSPAFAAEGYTVRRERPRILFTPGELPGLRAKMKSSAFARDFAELKAYVLKLKPGSNMWLNVHNSDAACFVYLMDHDPKVLPIIRTYVNILLPREAKPDHWTAGMRARSLSIIYDWCYDDLDRQERRRLAEGMFTLCEETVLPYWRHSDYMNQLTLHHAMVVFPGVALLEEGFDGLRPEWYLQSNGRWLKATWKRPGSAGYLDFAADLLRNHMVPARNQVAGRNGGWHESMSYLSLFLLDEMLQYQCWSAATGEDLFKKSTFSRNIYKFMVRARRNHDHQWVLSDDIEKKPGPGPQESGFTDPVIVPASLVGAHWRDPYVQYVRNHAPKEYMGRRWIYLAWYDPTIPELPDVTEEPLASLHEGIGWVIMRSGWGPQDTFAVFQCGDWYEGHQHHDENSFVIHKAASLAIDSGDYRGPENKQTHKVCYNRRTIAHNTILVHDPGEDTAGLPNDGGQLFPNVLNDDVRRFVTDAEGTPCDTGEIVAYETNDFYTYVCGDASRAYSPKKMRSFTRQFVYLRPDVFVVFDRVTTAKAAFPKTWLLHSIEEPVVDGNRFIIRHGDGKLFGYTLLPDRPHIEKVGGPGREFLVAGKNYPVDAGSEAGRWRLEVTPSAPGETDFFLHVLVVLAKDAPDPAPSTVRFMTQEREDGQVGCVVELGERRWSVTFDTEGPPGGKVVIEEVPGGRRLFGGQLTREVAR